HIFLFCPVILPRPPSSKLFPYTTLFRSLVEKWLRNRGKVPSLGGKTRGFYLMLGPRELSAAYRDIYGPAPFLFLTLIFEKRRRGDRKSTRLNSSHEWISYAVFCLKQKKY